MEDLTRRTALKGGLGAALVAALTPGCSPDPENIQRPWVGAIRTSGATVAVRVTESARARLKVARDATLSQDVSYSRTLEPDGVGMVKLLVDGLQPATQYHYGVEVDGNLADTTTGSFRTSPADPSSFTFVFGSCCDDVSSNIFKEIREHDPDLFIHLGDITYSNIDTDQPEAFRWHYNAVLSSRHLGPLLANVPSVYTWSDHDYGANNSDRNSDSRGAAQASYRHYVPSHELPSATGGIYHSFGYGRVRFIVTDNRSFRSPNSEVDDTGKTVLGTEQKAWFKEAVSTASEPLIVWANETPWVGAEGAGDDEWSNYSSERRELAEHIQGTGKNVVIIAGDMHALAVDDGTNSPGGIPVFQAACFSQSSNHKGGPYTHGPYPSVEDVPTQQYGLVRVRDTGSDITLEFEGYERGRISRLSYAKTYPLGS